MTEKTPFKLILCEVILYFLLHFGVVLCLPVAGKSLFTPYNIYHDTFILEKSVKHFGILTSMRLDVRNLFFGKSGEFIILQRLYALVFSRRGDYLLAGKLALGYRSRFIGEKDIH